MNNYQLYPNKYTKSHYQQNNKHEHCETKTAFHGTKLSPNAIIKNPMNGTPYLTENNDIMTVRQYGKYFFRVK